MESSILPSSAPVLWRVAPSRLANGTSLMGCVECSYALMRETFGEHSDGDGCKTSTEWVFEVRSGDEFLVATVYDYKEVDPCDAAQVAALRAQPIVDWHIGGDDPRVVGIVAAILGVHTWKPVR